MDLISLQKQLSEKPVSTTQFFSLLGTGKRVKEKVEKKGKEKKNLLPSKPKWTFGEGHYKMKELIRKRMDKDWVEGKSVFWFRNIK